MELRRFFLQFTKVNFIIAFTNLLIKSFDQASNFWI